MVLRTSIVGASSSSIASNGPAPMLSPEEVKMCASPNSSASLSMAHFKRSAPGTEFSGLRESSLYWKRPWKSVMLEIEILAVVSSADATGTVSAVTDSALIVAVATVARRERRLMRKTFGLGGLTGQPQTLRTQSVPGVNLT